MKIIAVVLVACVIIMNADLSHAECAGACPAIYLPVCAQNAQGESRRFSNDCDLSNHNCRNPSQTFTVTPNAKCD